MEVVVASFATEEAAQQAQREMTKTLDLDPSQVEIEHLGPQAEGHSGEPVLVAWVGNDAREEARDLVARRSGHHVPLDWVQALKEEVAPETFDLG